MDQNGRSLDEVTERETTASKIARMLRTRGYGIANADGMLVQEPLGHVIGILKPSEPVEINLGLFQIKLGQRALYLATLWLSNRAYGAKIDEKWFLHVYGKENIRDMEGLANELSGTYGITIDVSIGSEQPRFERRWWDYYGGILR